ncbi:MAG: hypothetical protein KAS53_03365 [Candidatus Cloacimonetes bacterium]|nr:hypothetical protein [Candidatus Cloacimonadota bacterium]
MLKLFFFLIGGFIIIIYSIKAAKNLRLYLIAFVILDSLRLLVKSNELLQQFSFLNNFMDLFGIISIIVIIIRFRINNYTVNNTRTFNYLFLFVFTFLIIYMISVLTYGVDAIKSVKSSFVAICFILALAGFENSLKNQQAFYSFIKLLVIATILLYTLRIIGILPMLYGASGYLSLRFITNSQTLYLIFFYVFFSRAKLFNISQFKHDKYLALIAFFLIITSTQRMGTLVFILFLFFDLLTNGKSSIKQVLLISSIGLMYIILFNPIYFVSMITSAFEPIVYNTESSNAGLKFYDIFASIKHIIENNQLLMGRLFQKEFFVRYYGDIMSSRATRGIHNLYISYLVSGGLFLFVPIILLTLHLLKINYKYFRKNVNYVRQIAFVILLITFIFLNSTGLPMLNAIALGYAIISSKKYIYEQ